MYKDKKAYYSFDKLHRTFEKTDLKGKHKGEMDVEGNLRPESVDKSGGNDLKI